MLIDDVLREYLYGIKTRNYTERTIKVYTKNISGILNVCKGRRGASYKHIFYHEE